MIDEKSNLTTIDALIQRKQPFAVYRVPGEKYPRLLTEDVGAVRLIFDLKELNGQRGFVIAPFRVDKSCPIVLIQSDRTGQPLPMEIVADNTLTIDGKSHQVNGFAELKSFTDNQGNKGAKVNLTSTLYFTLKAVTIFSRLKCPG